MSWERRGNHRYYYRKRRDGERVVSEYVGTGPLAQTAADLDAVQHKVRQLKRREWESLRALDAQVAEACDVIRTLRRSQRRQ